AEVTDQAAAETQTIRQRRGALPLQPGTDIFERIGVELFEAGVAAARVAQQPPHAAAARFDALRAGEADERVAAEALAADHRFQQIAVRTAGELDVHRERRVEIGARLGEHRNAGKAKGCEPVELGLNHALLRLQIRGTAVAAWTSASPSRAATRGGLAAPAAPAGAYEEMYIEVRHATTIARRDARASRESW